MKTLNRLPRAATLAASLLALAGCASLRLPGFGNADSASESPSAATVAIETRKATLARAHADLTALQADAELARLAPKEIAEAETAVKIADSSKYDSEAGAHLVYLAERRVQFAQSRAEARQLAAKLEALRAQRATTAP